MSARGVSLIELLVVLVILSLAASAVILNAPPRRPESRLEAEAFAARIGTSLEGAVLRSERRRLLLSEGRYLLQEYGSEEWRTLYSWPTIKQGQSVGFDSILTGSAASNLEALNGGLDDRFSNGVDVDDDEEEWVVLHLDPLGLSSQLEATFSDARDRWTVILGQDGEIIVTQEKIR